MIDGSERPVILSERSESKNPPNIDGTLSGGRPFRPFGDPSTRSSDSLAQGDMPGWYRSVSRTMRGARLSTVDCQLSTPAL